MFSRKRFIAGASAVALAAGTTLAGAGIAGAQGSSEIAADLGLAATALAGPVAVAGNAEGGPTVAYTNETGAQQTCVGFTLPYSTVDELGVDPSTIGEDPLAALPLLALIEAAGGVSVLTVDEDGEPVASDSGPDSSISGAAIGLLQGAGVAVPDDGTVEWVASSPDSPAAAVVMCVPDPDGGLLAINFGIDPQVVADQINDRLGPLGSIGPDMISAGSVEAGASALGSLGEAAGDDAGDDEGDDEEDTDTGSGSGGGSSAGSDEDDDEGTLAPTAIG